MRFSRAQANAGRHHFAAISDQAISSATNFLAVLAIARVLSPADFGVFAMAYTALTLFLGLSRSYFGIPLALAAEEGEAALKRLFSSSMSSMCVIFLPVAAIVTATGLLSANWGNGDQVGIAAMVGLATPLVMLQDISRYYAIAKGASGIAVISDGIWLLGIGLLILVAPFLPETLLLAVWCAIVALALVATVPFLRPRFKLHDGLGLLIPRRGMRESVAITVALSTGVTLLMGFLMVPFLGSVSVGTLRGAGTLFGPVNTLIALLDFSILGALVRRSRVNDIRSVSLVAGSLAFISMAWAVVLLVLPTSIGQALLGASWGDVRTVLPITSVEYVVLAGSAGLALVFKLRDRPRTLLINRVTSSVVILVSAFVFLVLGGDVRWMAASLLLGAVASVGGMIVSLIRERRRFLATEKAKGYEVMTELKTKPETNGA
jgi:O-antigen/teichoic acid export membrane protein